MDSTMSSLALLKLCSTFRFSLFNYSLSRHLLLWLLTTHAFYVVFSSSACASVGLIHFLGAFNHSAKKQPNSCLHFQIFILKMFVCNRVRSYQYVREWFFSLLAFVFVFFFHPHSIILSLIVHCMRVCHFSLILYTILPPWSILCAPLVPFG